MTAELIEKLWTVYGPLGGFVGLLCYVASRLYRDLKQVQGERLEDQKESNTALLENQKETHVAIGHLESLARKLTRRSGRGDRES